VTKTTSLPSPAAAVDYDATLILAVETSNKSWVLAAHVPGLGQVKSKQTIAPGAEALAKAIDGYHRRAAGCGKTADRVIVVYEAGYGGFWLARWLAARDIEAHVVQPSSVPVERRKRRAKSDKIDADLLLRTLLAWLRGEPRVCSMVAIPDEADEDARRPAREREELIRERIVLTNRIGAILATLGVDDYNPLRRDRRVRLDALRTALDKPLPEHAKAKIGRIIERLELILAQIAALECQRDAVLEDEAPGRAERMIQTLVLLRGIGAQSATVLVYEAFVRSFSSGKALGCYAGLTGTPFNSGSSEREQGISKSGNRRLRGAMGELAWLWLRYQPDSALAKWFRERLAGANGRMKKVLLVALARKLLIALWRYATHGVVPEGVVLKPAS
jgi:transposase